MRTLIVLVLFVAVLNAEYSPYKPRGWRPSGQRFAPHNGRLQTSYGPPAQTYGSPEASTYPPFTTTTTEAPTTVRTTTTPKSREPTTPVDVPEEEFDTNPALAIANSFAFNRPVYVYNTFPFIPGHVLVK